MLYVAEEDDLIAILGGTGFGEAAAAVCCMLEEEDLVRHMVLERSGAECGGDVNGSIFIVSSF